MRTISTDFHELCHKHRLAATHQRRVIYETVMSLHGHPSPEAIYVKVRKKVPSISLATVYKNIQTFLDSGMLREVSFHHGALRVEPNEHPHHHLVCVRCKTIMDIDESKLGKVSVPRKLPHGFRPQRIAVDILGTCGACSSKEARSKQSQTLKTQS